MAATKKPITEQEADETDLSLHAKMCDAIRHSVPGKNMKPKEVLDTLAYLRVRKA
jgi:hypothetical protein